MSHRPTAVVTGASRGIGRAIAKRLAERYDIVAVARSAAELETLANEIEQASGHCRPLTLDVTDPTAVDRSLSDVEADVLVNNAGVGKLRPLLELALDDWRRMVDVNFNALFYVTRVLLPGMVRRNSGFIVNIGSLAGRSSFVGGACYAATKHAVVGFSESLMLEVRDANVRVSVIMPGSVATDFSPGRTDTSWMLTPEEVADSVWYAVTQPAGALVSRIEIRPSKTK
jgi:NADP-dependent 3-hydroxy acid dehydrogenase YdfG